MAVDLEPAARRLAELVAGAPDGLLDVPTPCSDYCLGDLIHHVGGLALAFTPAARKDRGEASDRRSKGDASQLGSDWRDRIPRDLATLAEAWRDPEAWSGMTRIAGLDMPGEAAGVFALDELVVHGWDVAQASGQPYDCDPVSLEVVHNLVAQFCGPGMEQQRQGLFGPEIAVSDGAPCSIG